MNLFKIEANYIDIFNKEIYPTSIGTYVRTYVRT